MYSRSGIVNDFLPVAFNFYNSLDAGAAVSSVLGEFKYEPLKAVIDQMKEAGALSAEAIQQMYEEGEKIAETGTDLENPNYLLTVLIETLAELLGLDLTSGTEGFQFLAAALNGVGEAAGNATDGLNSINYETVDAAKSKVDAITAAMKDYKEYNGLTKSSVDKLTSAFPALRDALYDSEGKLTAQGKAALGSKAAMLALPYRILHFNDELLHGIKHSKEHFDQTLSDITEYDSYCAKHPDFKNQITIHATKNILQTYDKCTAEASFL